MSTAHAWSLQQSTVDAVLSHYGDKSAQYLIELTHREPPWQRARGARPPEEQSSPEIRLDEIADYYSGLSK